MRYDKERLDKDIENVIDICEYVKEVVWERQEGQENHFDRLNKAEQVALINILNQVANLSVSLKDYKFWFDSNN
jgi:hypothetical protein